jgi:hypothetical protein
VKNASSECECCAAQLAAGGGGHADDKRHAVLPARHVPDGSGGVEDLVERQQREIDRHDLDNRPQSVLDGTANMK